MIDAPETDAAQSEAEREWDEAAKNAPVLEHYVETFEQKTLTQVMTEILAEDEDEDDP
jgi:hypothetical protein